MFFFIHDMFYKWLIVTFLDVCLYVFTYSTAPELQLESFVIYLSWVLETKLTSLKEQQVLITTEQFL